MGGELWRPCSISPKWKCYILHIILLCGWQLLVCVEYYYFPVQSDKVISFFYEHNEELLIGLSLNTKMWK